MSKKYFLVFLLLVLMTSFVASDSDFYLGNFRKGTNISLINVCPNCTYTNLSTVLFPNSTFALLGEYSMTKNGTIYNYSFTSTNTIGRYVYVMHSDLNGVNTSSTAEFDITPSGESPTTATSFFYIGLLALLIIFFILILGYGFDTDNIIGKTFAIGFGYLSLMGILFIAWQMAESFIYNSPFLIEFLRIFFIVLTIGFFPLLILLFAYGIYMMTQIREIKDMQKRGLSMDEVNERRGRR